jgi:RND family efflux transporter MFP subunit
MKNALILFSFFLVFISCQQEQKIVNPSLDKLKKEKAKLLITMDSLSEKLKTIEGKISKLDTLKKLQKVTVFQVKDTLFKHYITLQGTVASDQNINLHPEYGGTVQRLLIKEGEAVRKGQLLIQLDALVLQDKMVEVKTQLDLAKTTFERQERLWNQKIGTEMAYLGAKTQKEALENSLNSLNTQFNKMQIKAPFSGVVEKIYAKVGELSNPQFPLLRLINLNKMYIEADVPETYLSKVKKGTEVLLNFGAINQQIHAKIAEVGNFINPNNRSFRIKINIDNKEHFIKPNMLVDLKLNDFQGKGVVLPSSLIQMNQQKEEFVYVLTKQEGKDLVEKRVLDLGETYDNKVLILNGLKSGEMLVNEGGKLVKHGDEVRLD